MPAAAPRAQRAAARLRGTAAPPSPPPALAKRTRPPTADSSVLASSPLPRPSSRAIVVSDGPLRSPTKRSRTSADAPDAPSAPTGRPTTPAALPPTTEAGSGRNANATKAAPLTASIPADVADICGIPDSYAGAVASALAIVHAADPHSGAALDTILQKLFYTVTSQALRIATQPLPAPTPAPASRPPGNDRPPPTYASKAAAQTTPLPQQTRAHPSNHGTTATKPPPYDEVFLHTSRMTSPPSNETIIGAVTAAAKGRTPATAVRQLPSGDCAVVFPGATDRWYVKDLSWATDLGAEATVTGPRVVLRNVPIDTLLLPNLISKLNTPCPVLQARPMIRRGTNPAPLGSLCLTMATEADADLLLRNGAIIGYGFHYASPYREDHRPKICHRCQTWGHSGRNCRKPPRCAHCGGAHSNRACDKPENDRHCANCRGPHPAYSRSCPVYHVYLNEYRTDSGAGRRPPPARPLVASPRTPQLPPLDLSQ